MPKMQQMCIRCRPTRLPGNGIHKTQFLNADYLKNIIAGSIRPQPVNVLAVPRDVFDESPGLRDVFDEVERGSSRGASRERVRPARFHPRPCREGEGPTA